MEAAHNSSDMDWFEAVALELCLAQPVADPGTSETDLTLPQSSCVTYSADHLVQSPFSNTNLV